MLDAGLKVTVLSNKDAYQRVDSENLSLRSLPFGAERVSKLLLMLRSSSIRQKVIELAKTHDIVYITGKLLFLTPDLKRANQDAKIIAHLHDYQLVCPHASLHNFLTHGRCGSIWNSRDCMRCAYRYGYVESHGVSQPFLDALSTAMWKHAVKLPDLIDSVDSFITVSRAQRGLIASALGEHDTTFLSKNVTLYNPVEANIGYVPPSFGSDYTLGFFGGARYIKGYDLACGLVKCLDGLPIRLLVAGSNTSAGIRDEGRVEHLGNLSAAEVAELYKKVWIVLFTSRVDEPLPYILVEAQLRGRPILASKVGGVHEVLVKDGYTGRLVDPVGFKSAVEDLLVLLDDKPCSYTEEISAMAREFFHERSTESYDNFLKLMI